MFFFVFFLGLRDHRRREDELVRRLRLAPVLRRDARVAAAAPRLPLFKVGQTCHGIGP
jgi:hypothetical protein